MGAETTNDITETSRDTEARRVLEPSRPADALPPPEVAEREVEVKKREPSMASSQIETR
ncbi:MAG: hypothetical protein RMA76_30235 [Deltaproteobacteria bacterium]|jgi:hypothetical protein